ncbi:LamG-like jellyroll fold domain-containing protein [Catellatospora citrea]|uniref:LamG-like jellyroll fold domain-containing protein n=1 Tax=Catellatospora citrea TaxID=53366 RepID=UPI000FF78B36|nr:LamG-like jellyroll fold domain-containing protein [Catellatospora citrea]RKE06352.1 YD repeat-containing protein [Catellatospora citrea]
MSRTGRIRLRRDQRGGRRRGRLATLLVFVLLVNLGMPAGAVPPSGDLPLSWLWSWIPQSGAWAAAFTGTEPVRLRPGRPDDHHVPTSETDANGVSRAPAEKKREGKPHKVKGRDGVFDERSSKRVAAGADARSDLYQNTDGSYSRKVFTDPVNYRDAKGTWQPIDRTLSRGPGGRFQQKASDLDVTLAASADDPRLVTLSADRTHSLSYGLAGAAASAGVAQHNAVSYADVLPGVDFKVEVTASGAKDTLILDSPDVPSSFLFRLDLRGLAATLESNGSVLLRDEKGDPRITIPAGFMQDGKFDQETGDFTRSDDVAYELVEVDGRQALRVTPDAAWLHDPARVYPVILDPSSFATSGDSYAYKTDDSDHSGENNLPVGTYDGGTHVARSYLQFANFATSFNGATISNASLALFLSWSYNCSATKFDVRMVNAQWMVTTVKWPGPTLGPSIGEASPAPGPACGNTSGNRSVGTWVSVPLQAAAIQTWLTGTANYGLALTARDENASNQWKRFTSRNYDNFKKAPFLLLTYTGPGTPQIDGAYPPSGYITPTLTPVLIAEGHDPDGSGTVTYNFAVTKEDGTLVAQSGYQAATSWTVPAGKLVRGTDYTWQVTVTDGTSTSPPKLFALSTQPVQPLVTSRLSQNGGRGFEPSAGNYTTSATDAQLPTVGPALAVTRSYNSQDSRAGLAFGTGWSSAFDAKLVEVEKDANGIAQSVSITYPTGQEAVFGKTGGSFATPPGRSGVLKCLSTAGAVIACPTAAGTAISGYRLTDKSGNAYTFATVITPGTYGLTEQSDLAQRKLTYHYTAGRLDRITSASGRSLNVLWSGGHVVEISTDRADASDPLSVSEWTYSYTGDLLTAACAPAMALSPDCIGYEYTSGSGTQYPSVVDNLAPTSNWRLTETDATTAASSALAQGGVDNGIYTDVTLGEPGPLAGSAATAAGFNGASSTVTLPISLANESGYRSASIWFKTTQRGGVLLSQSGEPVTTGTTNWGYTPVLYVNSSGRLSGQFPSAPAVGAVGSLVGAGSGLCVGPVGGVLADGRALEIQACNGDASQQWTLDSAGRLVATEASVTKCAEVVGTAGGSLLRVWTCGAGTNQKWTMMPNGQIIGLQSQKCMDVPFAATTAGTVLQIFTCHPAPLGNQQFFGSAHTPIVASAAAPVVDDGEWHHAVLSASGNSQTLYVDGVAAGTKLGLIVGGQQKYQHIGAGFLGLGWPGQSTGTANTNTGTAAFFEGSIAEVAYFDKPLRQQDVDALRAAQATPAELLNKIVTPLGKTAAEIDYDTAAGVVSQVTDENGGTWGISPPSVEGSYLVYSSAVLGAGPTDYWRLADSDGVDAVNEVNGGLASYGTGVTLGEATGPFGDESWAARFDGTGGHVSIPDADIPTGGPYSISMWFRVPDTSTGGGTLFGYQNQPLGTTPTLYNPGLYVGSDGRLRGKLWVAGMNPMATPGRVDDGQWHHVALSASTNSQAMYLDGQLVGSAAGTITPNGAPYAYLGAGGSQGWPNARNDITGYFTGDIAEVAVYKAQQLNSVQIKAQYDARIKAQGRGLIKKYAITDPSDADPDDANLTSASYALPAGTKVAETDAYGNETIYGFDGTGMLQTVVDPNGNYTETVRDSRGNIREQISCTDRSASPPTCSTVYYEYKFNAANPDDPCNDLMFEVRDGRSSSRADNTYRTSYTYDRKCNLIVSEDPLLRRMTTAFSGDRDTAAADGGFIPAGLPIRVVSPSGATQHVTYYASGDVATVTDPAGKVTSYEYDGLGRVIERTNQIAGQPDQVVLFAYDKQSRLRQTTEPEVTNQVTGAAHRARTTIEYDADGNTTRQYVEDLSGGDAARQTVIEYDEHNQRAKVVDALGNEVGYTYDSYGNLITETRPDGVTVSSTYDAGGRMLTTAVKDWTDDPNDPSPATDLVTLSKGYDPAGRVAWVEDAEHWRIRYDYYDNNQVKRVLRTDDAEPPTVAYLLEENFYDGAGNLIRQVTNNGQTNTTYRVDAASRTDQAILDPGGLHRVTETRFDADNRPVSNIARNAQGAVLAQDDVAYDVMNRVLSKTAYNGPAGIDLGRVATSRWTLDSAIGAATSDSSGNNPLTTSGGVTWSTDHGATHTSGSAVFDGTGVITGRTTSIDTANSFTIATWVKLDPAAAVPMVVASQDGEQVSGFTLSYNKATGLWTFSMPRGDDKGSGVESASSSAAASTGVWTHLAGVYDAANKKLKIYVNGAKVGETTRTGAPWSAGGKFVIGGGKSGSEGNNRVDLIGRDAAGNLLFYPNTGTGPATVFGTAVTLATGFNTMNFVDAGDFDGDRKPDIIARDTSGTVWLYPNTSSGGTVSLGTRYSLGTGFSGMNWLGVGDVDGDGRDDLVGRIPAGSLWLHRSSGAPGQVKLAEVGQNIGSTGFANMNWIDFGDVNNDGREDMVVRYTPSGDLYEYAQNDGKSLDPYGGSSLTGSGWNGFGVSIGDLTGDGRPDLVARNTNSDMYVYANSGEPAPNMWQPATRIGSSSWAHLNLFVTADLNGDPVGRWRGSIDDVQTYQRALSDADVSLLRTAGSPTFPANGSNVSRVSYEVNDGGLVTSTTDALGNVTDLAYDELGRAVRTTSPEVAVETYGSAAVQARAFTELGYDTFGAVQESRDPLGRVTTAHYDALGRVTETIMPAYTPPGSPTPLTPVSTTTYDSTGRVKTVTDPLDRTVTYDYDQLGRMAKVTDPAGNSTTYTYNRLGNQTSVTDPTGARTTATYGFLGPCSTTQHVRQPSTAAYTTQYGYGLRKIDCNQDPDWGDATWQTQTRSPGNLTTSLEHNAVGDVTRSYDAAGKDTDYTFDGLGRPLRTTLYDNSYAEAVYDLAGQVTKVREFSATGTELATGSTRYDRGGQVVGVTDAMQHETTFAYDATGLLTSQVQPLSATDSILTSFGYDLAGQQTRFTDGRGSAFWTTYNTWGLPESSIEPATTAHPDPSQRTFTNVYDAAGQPKRLLSPGGVSVDYAYDDLGNLLSQTGTAPETSTAAKSFTYDAIGQMRSFSGPSGTTDITYDDRGLPLTIRGGSGDNDFAWNADGQLTSRTDAAGTTTFGYDSAGRLDTIANATAGLNLNYDYNDLSAVSRITYGGGNYRTYTYDNRHRIDVDELKTAGGTSIAKIDYGFDDNGNETSKSTVGFGAGTANANAYTYDWANRLKTWTTGSTTTNYAYDKSGNRVQSGAATFTYDQRNRLLTSGSTTYAYTPGAAWRRPRSAR